MVRTRLNIGCRYSTPVLERPLHPTRSQFKPQPSQTQAPVTPATEPERRAGGGLTTAKPHYGISTWSITRWRGAPGVLDETDVQGGASPTAIAAIRLPRLTGCRKNEIRTLRWGDVDL